MPPENCMNHPPHLAHAPKCILKSFYYIYTYEREYIYNICMYVPTPDSVIEQFPNNNDVTYNQHLIITV